MSVQKYYEKFLTLSEGLDVNPSIMQAFFTNGLLDRIKTYVNLRRPNTLSETLTLAKQGELLPPTKGDLTNEKIDNLDSKLDTLAKAIGINTRQTASITLVPPPPPPEAPVPRCQICHHTDHVATVCPVRTQQLYIPPACQLCQATGHDASTCSKRFAAQNRGEPSKGNPIICYNCGKAGHIARMCQHGPRGQYAPRFNGPANFRPNNRDNQYSTRDFRNMNQRNPNPNFQKPRPPFPFQPPNRGQPNRFAPRGVGGRPNPSINTLTLRAPLSSPLTSLTNNSSTIRAKLAGKCARVLIDTGSNIDGLSTKFYSQLSPPPPSTP